MAGRLVPWSLRASAYILPLLEYQSKLIPEALDSKRQPGSRNGGNRHPWLRIKKRGQLAMSITLRSIGKILVVILCLAFLSGMVETHYSPCIFRANLAGAGWDVTTGSGSSGGTSD